jgi:hypothetical protein
LRNKFAVTLGSRKYPTETNAKTRNQAKAYAWAKRTANRKARHRGNQHARQDDEDCCLPDTHYILVREEKDGNGFHRLR